MSLRLMSLQLAHHPNQNDPLTYVVSDLKGCDNHASNPNYAHQCEENRGWPKRPSLPTPVQWQRVTHDWKIISENTVKIRKLKS